MVFSTSFCINREDSTKGGIFSHCCLNPVSVLNVWKPWRSLKPSLVHVIIFVSLLSVSLTTPMAKDMK